LIIIVQIIAGIYPFLIIDDRVGKQGKLFGLLQFNTGAGKTKIGRFLYTSTLYKIPQVINLFLGSLSVIGPQAEPKEVVEELRKRIKFYNRRLMVRPGLTGWAQLKSTRPETLKQRHDQFKNDLFYLENMSLLFDLRILLRSLAGLVIKK
jgi:lipopolysaccharide/colanic/teichoic acid biosynthesis glycosyltransferase